MKTETKTELTKAQIEFMRSEFSVGSGIETCEGTKAMWKSLEAAGLVTKMPYGGMMGHPFSYNITDEGREVVRGHYKASWVKVNDPEEIHQYRCAGGSFGIGAVAGACGPSTVEIGKFWTRAPGMDKPYMARTLNDAKYIVAKAVWKAYGTPDKEKL